MGTPFDVALGRLAAAHGFVAADVVRQCYDALPAGRSLAEDLVGRGLLDPARAQFLVGQVQQGGGRVSGRIDVQPHPSGRHPQPTGRVAPPPSGRYPGPGAAGPITGPAAVDATLRLPAGAAAQQSGGDLTMRLPAGQASGVQQHGGDLTTRLPAGQASGVQQHGGDLTMRLPAGQASGVQQSGGDLTMRLPAGQASAPQASAPQAGDDATLRVPAPGATIAAAPPQAADGGLPAEGDIIADRYEVRSVLGKGGMGAVYRARDRKGGDEVALKVMLAGAGADADALLRFRREAEVMARVDAHAGIVRIRDAGIHAGRQPYAAMDLVTGKDLHAIVKADGPLPVDEALRLTEAVCRAVHHCHLQKIVHRDLKPANVILREEDRAPLVMDFGLALAQEQERMTKTGQVMGTPAYMPPEQAEGDKAAIDAQSDVYSLGAILYELVTGRAPFQGEPMQILKQVFVDSPPPVQAARPDAPPDLDVICQKAMAKDKGLRYATAAALADDVGRLRRGEPITARAPTRVEEFRWRLRRRDRKAMVQFAAMLLTPVAALGVLSLVARGPFIAWLEARAPRAMLRVVLDQHLPPVATSDPLLGDRQGGAATAIAGAINAVTGDAARPGGEPSTLERLAAPDSNLADLLGEGEEGPAGAPPLTAGQEREALRTLARRVRVRDACWTDGVLDAPTPDASPEDLLMSGLTRLGWNISPVGSSPITSLIDRDKGRALVAAAARSRGPAQVAAKKVVDNLADIERGIERYVSSVTDEVITPAIASIQKGSQAPQAEVSTGLGFEPLPPLKVLADRWLLERKRRCLDDAVKALVPAVRDTAIARWQAAPPYLAAARAINTLKQLANAPPTDDKLVGIVATAAVEVVKHVSQIANPLGEEAQLRARGDAIKGEVLEAGMGALVGATEGLLDLTADETILRHHVYNALVPVLVNALAQQRLPTIDVIMVLPRLRHLPTERNDNHRLITEALDAGVFERWTKVHGTADAYLVWGEAVDSRTGNDDVAHSPPLVGKELEPFVIGRREVCRLLANAMGERLEPAMRERLGLPAAIRLDAPLADYWAPRLAGKLVLNRVRLEQDIAKTTGKAVDPAVLDACLELLERTRAPDLPPSRFHDLMKAADGVFYALDQLGLDPVKRRALQVREIAWLDASIEVGAVAADYCKGRRTPPGAVVGSLADIGDYNNEALIDALYVDAVVERAFLHEQEKDFATARALVDRALAHIQGGPEPACTLRIELFNIAMRLAEHHEAQGRKAEAEAEHRVAIQAAQTLIDEIGEPERRGLEGEKLQRYTDDRSNARSTIALAQLRLGQPDLARDQLARTRAAKDRLTKPRIDGKPGFIGYWGDVLPALGESP